MDIGMMLTMCLLLPCMTSEVLKSQRNAVAVSKKAIINERLASARIRMMRRIVRNFVHGQEASITLVFHCTREVYIRWFKRAGRKYDGSEVPGYFPIDGDPKYTMELLVADDVIAATLRMKRYKAPFPTTDSYETIISARDGSVQYNIRTDIEQEINIEIHKIDSPEWDKLPQDVVFAVGGQFEVVCQAFVNKELLADEDNIYNKFNELNLKRIIGKLDIDADKDMLLKIYRNSDPYQFTNQTEERDSDPYIISGYRLPTKYDHVIYEAKLTTRNATVYLEGIYQCSMERENQQGFIFEKSYANSKVVREGNPSPYIENKENINNHISSIQKKTIRAILKPCEESKYKNIPNHAKKQLEMRSGVRSCFRCVAMGYPKPRIRLIKNGQPVLTRKDITMIESMNVADGGLVETTYVFHNPTRDNHQGQYKCEGRNGGGRSALNFDLIIKEN